LGERLLCKQEVDGSIPFTSTSSGIRYQVSDARGRGAQADREKQKFAFGRMLEGDMIFDRVKREYLRKRELSVLG
jgi:hypothetical protein